LIVPSLKGQKHLEIAYVLLGLYEKDRASTAAHVVNYFQNQLTLLDLPYSKAVAVVTDTEATMISAGSCLFSFQELSIQ
jgi:hypothetical protein